MKYVLILFLIFSSTIKSQVIKDTIFGKPKFVKEYVLFLNESGPFTFMQGDSEYGHATGTDPKFLRSNMSRSWFSSNFCRYINNETWYDLNRNLTQEIWYRKSGEMMKTIQNKYDYLERLTNVLERDKYSYEKERYFYEGENKRANFKESRSKWIYSLNDDSLNRSSNIDEIMLKMQNEPEKIEVKNLKDQGIIFEFKYNKENRTDSIFEITNKRYKEIENSFITIEDSIFSRKLSKVKVYNENFQVVEEKVFNFEDDLFNLKTTLTKHMKYEYNEQGRIIKEVHFNDGFSYSYIINAQGKVISEVKKENGGKNYYTLLKYDDEAKLLEKTHVSDGRISNQEKYEYDGNYIKKLIYSHSYGEYGKELRTSTVTFKYSFDKQKNWTEIIKNVDGKDLYLWKREIQYYK